MDSFGNVGEKKKELKNSKHSKRKKRKIEVNEINRTSYSGMRAAGSTGLPEAVGLALPPPLQGLPAGRLPRAAPPALPVLEAVPQLSLLQLAAELIQIPEKQDGLTYSVCSAFITAFKT